MNKDTVIQIRISSSDKEKLKNIAFWFDTTVSKMLTDYLDSIIEKGKIELFKINNKSENKTLTKEELSEIVGGANAALLDNNEKLAKKILSKYYMHQYTKNSKDSFINIRYPKDRKDKIDSIVSNNGITVSSMLDNYIKHSVSDYERLRRLMNPTDEEIAEDFKQADEDYKNGRCISLEEFENNIKERFGEDIFE